MAEGPSIPCHLTHRGRRYCFILFSKLIVQNRICIWLTIFQSEPLVALEQAVDIILSREKDTFCTIILSILSTGEQQRSFKVNNELPSRVVVP